MQDGTQWYRSRPQPIEIEKGAIKQNPGSFDPTIPLTQNPGYLEVPGVGVTLPNASNGIVIITTKRGSHGQIALGTIPAGNYVLEIDGPRFAEAVDALVAPPPPSIATAPRSASAACSAAAASALPPGIRAWRAAIRVRATAEGPWA
jgi:hypothetical protein